MTRRKKKPPAFHDDGRTVADMSALGFGGSGAKPENGEPLTKRERRAMILALYGAVLKIVFVFVAAAFLVMLFIQFVWFGG